jgi:predicted dehydrogenase
MDKLRFGIVGIGNMGSGHAMNLNAGVVPEIELTAVCDIKEDRRQWAKDHLKDSVQIYSDAIEMYEKAPLDAVIVATPHYFHPSLVIAALNHGLHAISEKPIGVYTLAAKEEIEVARKSDKVFGIMFNQRTNPVYQKVKELVSSGEIGEIKRVVWLITDWYRSQSYYDSGSWRATWGGEGGGVLLNQCPHNLDLLQWIAGMPCGVRAFMKYGWERNIEVENDVTAFLQYPNGATGLFVTSTHETPGTNRLEISADRGKIVVENNKITYWRNRVGEKEFNDTFKGGFGNPEVWKIDATPDPRFAPKLQQHMGVFQNFANHVLHGTPLLAPGEEGIRGLQLSNAMHLSDWTGQMVDPNNIDEVLFKKLLDEHIANSTFKKAETDGATLDTSNSYGD